MTAEAAALRRRQSRADARRAILDAAESLLVEVGYDGFSVRKLVDRCGYSAPTLYHYFGDKTGLIHALLEERLRKLVAELRAVPESHDPVEKMRSLMRAFVRFGRENPSHYALLTQLGDEDAEPVPAGEEASAILLQPLEELAARGGLVHPDVELVRQSIWVHVHGMISLPSARPDVEWCEGLIEEGIEAVVRGWVRTGAGDVDAAVGGER